MLERIAVQQMPNVTNKHLPQREYLESLGYKKVTHVYAEEVYDKWHTDRDGTNYQLDRGIGTYSAKVGENIVNIVVKKYEIFVLLFVPTISPRPFYSNVLKHHFAVEKPMNYLMKKYHEAFTVEIVR